MATYAQTIQRIITAATQIVVARLGGDGRIESAMGEGPFLETLKSNIHVLDPTADVVISPPRAACDIMVNGLRINLKLTDCKSSDNSANKPSIFYSITGSPTYPYSSTWNDFSQKLVEAKANGQIKLVRARETEYHYLVKNKITGQVLLKSIFDIHTYVSNPSNDLQINWKNEFEHKDYATTDADYVAKVGSLIKALQTSVRQMIERTKAFAEANVDELLR